MATYEREMSFSLLRGLICTFTPVALILFFETLYFAFGYDYQLSEAFATSSEYMRSWYRLYPVYLLSAHFFIFLATIAYRRRLINWWAQIITLTGLSFAALALYLTFRSDNSINFPFPNTPLSRADGQRQANQAPRRPNLLSGIHPTTAQPVVQVLPDANGNYLVQATSGSSSFVFSVAPQYEITTIAYERLSEFSRFQCTPVQYTTPSGLVDACSMTIPELAVAGIRATHVPAVFISTVSDRSFLGRDLLTVIGYRRDAQAIFLGRPPT
jgi:hypothetical protein